MLACKLEKLASFPAIPRTIFPCVVQPQESFSSDDSYNKISMTKRHLGASSDIARDVTGFYAFSPPGYRATFSTFWADLLALYFTENLEKMEIYHRRQFQKMKWRRDREVADFCPCRRGRTCTERTENSLEEKNMCKIKEGGCHHATRLQTDKSPLHSRCGCGIT